MEKAHDSISRNKYILSKNNMKILSSSKQQLFGNNKFQKCTHSYYSSGISGGKFSVSENSLQ
jgi:hypothetical protein